MYKHNGDQCKKKKTENTYVYKKHASQHSDCWSNVFFSARFIKESIKSALCYLLFDFFSVGNLKDADYYVHKRPHIACCVNRVEFGVCVHGFNFIVSFYSHTFDVVVAALLLCARRSITLFLAVIFSRTMILYKRLQSPCSFIVVPFADYTSLLNATTLIVFIWIELINYSN